MRKLITFLIILLFLASGCISEPETTCEETITEMPQLISNAQSYPTSTVQRVIDGDTLVLADGEKVRLIGIDTPEKDEEYYSEATQKLEQLALNQTLYLEQDISEKGKYGRSLYYLYTEDIFINAEMVASGYARSYPYEPDTKYLFLFDCLEQQAKEQELNIWS